MKTFRIITAVLGMAALLLSCQNKEHELSTQNMGKARPTLSVEKTDNTLKTYELTFTLSADTKYYGYAVYAVYPEQEIKAPTAYQIVTGVCQDAVLNKVEKASTTVSSGFCVDTESYKVFAAAITETGLLSEVQELEFTIPGALPKFSVKDGVYEIRGTGEKHPDAQNPKAGETSVKITIEMYNAVTYLMASDYFGHFPAPNREPFLVGKPDFTTNQLVFDGSTYDPDDGFDSSNCFFYNLYWYWNDARTEAAGLIGSGDSRKGAARFQGDDATSLLTEVVDGFGVYVYENRDGGWYDAYLYDFAMPGAEIVYLGD